MSESVTIRVDTEILEKLRIQAQHKKITLNTLMSQILTSHTEWEINSLEAGWIPIPRQVLKKLCAQIDEKEIDKYAISSAKNVTKEIILLMYGSYNVENFLKIIRQRCSRSGFNIKEINLDSEHRIVIQHDMGINWSQFHCKEYEWIFHDLGINAYFEVTENMMVIKLPLNIT